MVDSGFLAVHSRLRADVLEEVVEFGVDAAVLLEELDL